MSDTLSRAVEAVRNNERSSVSPGFLRPIDTDLIANELNIAPLATERGRQEMPESAAVVLDMVEQKIVHRLESEWRWQSDELLNNLRAYAGRLANFSVQADFAKLKLAADNALTRLRNAHVRALANLAPLQEAYIGARKELSDFRIAHRLTRPARVPAGRWTTFGLLVVMTFFESVLNGLFFAKGSKYGIVGGVGTAIGISLVNVVIAFFWGLGPVRCIHHRSFFVKSAGAVVVCIGLAMIVVLHLFAMHYREAVAQVGEQLAFNAAIETLTNKPFLISDLNTLYLFLLGLVFAGIAVWKGYKFDDPYIGYGRTFRTAETAREEYSDEHAELFDELEEIKEKTVTLLDAGMQRIPLFPQQAANVQNERAALVESFRVYEASIETATNQLLSLYRDSNRTYRKTKAPAYFSTRWSLPRSALESAESRTLISGPDFQNQNTTDVISDIQRLSKEVLDEYEKLNVAYPHPSQMA